MSLNIKLTPSRILVRYILLSPDNVINNGDLRPHLKWFSRLQIAKIYLAFITTRTSRKASRLPRRNAITTVISRLTRLYPTGRNNCEAVKLARRSPGFSVHLVFSLESIPVTLDLISAFRQSLFICLFLCFLYVVFGSVDL